MNTFLKKNGFSCLSSGFALCGACVGLTIAFLTEIACGNFYIYRFLLLPRHSPPIFFFFLIYTLFCALCGYLYAAVYAAIGEMKKGILPLLCGGTSILFLSLWYISFFKSCAFGFALFLMLFSIIMAFLSVKDQVFCRFALLIPALSVMIGYLWFIWFNISIILLN